MLCESDSQIREEHWYIEFRGIRVLAVHTAHGFQLRLTDPDRQFGAVANRADPIPVLTEALPIARAWIERHVFDSHRITVDSRELFDLRWIAIRP
jgi:hypothetical protein